VRAFGLDFFWPGDQCAVEGRDIAWAAARNQVAVDDDFLLALQILLARSIYAVSLTLSFNAETPSRSAQ
jgi:hypothetical protein